ncbi:HU family DNA-binding protein [Amphritea sp. 2_MG-2023]|uniref:HU family DNA-binding protein n=1 Tax=Amphritea TaxID=515417 RepID=UPI001C070DEA|nr:MULTISPECIES: HU family DNA-binding protein [Amphritea]MBU2967080.1 HU family DNA-binding protein [Amphritea atlantica]MDO6419367.1 HU family DNA-binding protein [Amphritea sp. 2_MG-2023]
MNKAELVNAIANASNCTKTLADHMLVALGNITTAELIHGGEVTLPGLGKLAVGDRAARTGRNPQTGAPMDIPAAKVAKFKPLKALKDALN